MELVLIWSLFGVVSGVVAGARGRSGCGWFLMGVLLGPFGLLLVALLPSQGDGAAPSGGPTPDTHNRCPDCAELVLRQARKCRHCGCRLIPD